MLSYISLRVLITAIVLSVVTLLPVARARPAPRYVSVPFAQPSDTPGRTEVLEFFVYTCGHCATVESFAAAWTRTLPDDAAFGRVPMAFNAHMKPMQQLYCTLLALDRSDLHPKVFPAMHEKG